MTTTSTTEPSEAIFRPGDFLQDGRYALYKKLGHGGMGEVWAARDLHRAEGHKDSWVAIKVLRPSRNIDEDVARRLRAEIDTLLAVQHPHLVHAYEAGTDDSRGIFYYVMEYLLGATLQDALTKTGGLPLSNALRFVAKIGAASHALHRAGVIHRDLKPDNIMIARGGRPVLIDLGIAKRDPKYFPGRSTLRTDADARLGTMDYMSPEQCMGEALDPRSDVYALGLISYVTMAGYHPAQGRPGGLFPTDFRWWSGWHLNNEPKPLYDVKSWIHPKVAEAVAKAMAKKPADRYRSAAELVHAWEDLAEWLLDHRLSTPPKTVRRPTALGMALATTEDAASRTESEPLTIGGDLTAAREQVGMDAPSVQAQAQSPQPRGGLAAALPTICGPMSARRDETTTGSAVSVNVSAVNGGETAPHSMERSAPTPRVADGLPFRAERAPSVIAVETRARGAESERSAPSVVPASTPNGTEIVRVPPQERSGARASERPDANAGPRTRNGTQILRVPPSPRGETGPMPGSESPRGPRVKTVELGPIDAALRIEPVSGARGSGAPVSGRTRTSVTPEPQVKAAISTRRPQTGRSRAWAMLVIACVLLGGALAITIDRLLQRAESGATTSSGATTPSGATTTTSTSVATTSTPVTVTAGGTASATVTATASTSATPSGSTPTPQPGSSASAPTGSAPTGSGGKKATSSKPTSPPKAPTLSPHSDRILD